MSLLARIGEVFAANGVLSRAAEPYTPRPGQIDMATAIGETIESGGVLVVEAGTGVGKTFAYLVPALLSGERVLLSTATKTLQDQLFGRDLPGLLQALGLPLRTALLKGRASYVCLHRLEGARWEVDLADRAALKNLAVIEQWARTTRSGDLAELPDLDERSPLIPLVTSTRDNCLGTPCPQARNCHVNLARRDALAADVVVVNHHLVFADLAVRESGVAELLPTVRIAIFDEAHQLNETGVQFLGVQLSTGQLLDLARDTLATGLQQARGLVDWPGTVAVLEHAARDLRLAVGVRGTARLNWHGVVPEGLVASAWQPVLQALHEALLQAATALDTVSELAPDFVRLQERARSMAERTQRFMQAGTPGVVRWLDAGGAQLRLMESPLDIAQAMQSRLLGEGEKAAARSWVFTSATLGDDAALSWFTEACGLTGARTLRVESPFDYAAQAALYVPGSIVKPADPAHSAQVAVFAAEAAQQLRGRTLVLTTTLRALRAIGEALQAHFADQPGIEVLVQGQGPKRRLMDRFRQGDAQGQQPGCVLVASASFWEGVDVPGDALQLVIIDKLPFPPPNDPLVEARAQRAESLGRKPFMDYFVPEAAVALKQGAGRLIRRESDRGVLVVCDTRLTRMGYGRRLRAALPPMRHLKTQEEFEQALQALQAPGPPADGEVPLTRPSTTASLWP